MCLHHVPTCGCPKMALNEIFWVSRQKLINRKKYIYDTTNQMGDIAIYPTERL